MMLEKHIPINIVQMHVSVVMVKDMSTLVRITPFIDTVVQEQSQVIVRFVLLQSATVEIVFCRHDEVNIVIQVLCDAHEVILLAQILVPVRLLQQGIVVVSVVPIYTMQTIVEIALPQAPHDYVALVQSLHSHTILQDIPGDEPV